MQDSLCPGRFQLQKQWDQACPEPEAEENGGNPEDMDSDREAGKRIHLLYAGKECEDASWSERDRAEKGLLVDAGMKALWLAQFDFEPVQEIKEYREVRWWLYDETGKETYSGQTDVVWIRGTHGGPADILLGDLKGLWGNHDPAPINMQLRRYIALIAHNIENLGFTSLRSASAYLNQPAKTLTPVLTPFSEDDIAMAVLEMNSDVAAITDPNAPRIAGSVQCHRCRAKLICPEYQASQGILMASVSPVTGKVPTKENIRDSIQVMDSEQLAKILPWIPALKDVADMAVSEAKRRLKIDALSIPGWCLAPNSARSRIDDVLTLFNRMSNEYGVESKEFTSLCSITKTALTELLRKKSKLKGRALEDKLDEIMKGTFHLNPTSPSLEKIKG